jgi:hypothetical protein
MESGLQADEIEVASNTELTEMQLIDFFLFNHPTTISPNHHFPSTQQHLQRAAQIHRKDPFMFYGLVGPADQHGMIS